MPVLALRIGRILDFHPFRRPMVAAVSAFGADSFEVLFANHFEEVCAKFIDVIRVKQCRIIGAQDEFPQTQLTLEQ